MSNVEVKRFNGQEVRTLKQLAMMVESCTDDWLVFDFADHYMLVLESSARDATPSVCDSHGLSSNASADVLEAISSLKKAEL